MKDNRRNFIKKSASLAAAVSVTGLSAYSEQGKVAISEVAPVASLLNPKIAEWPLAVSPNWPKLCVGASPGDRNQMRQAKQSGVDYILTGGPELPWTEKSLRAIMDPFKAEGLTVINMMIGGHPNTIFGRDGRDEEIRIIQDSLRAAGAAGLPVVEYNFYAHRLMEGYYEKKGRGGSGITAFDYERAKNVPNDQGPLMTSEKLWDNLTYFLKAVVPVAEKAGVRMALHPNDPPPPMTHGSAQIMGDLKGWKRLIEIVDSPSNGITFDCGVTNEIGEDPVEVVRYFGSRDRINHQHFRNANLEVPREKYVEQFVDEGDVNMFAVMQELVRLKYKFGLFPEHPHGLDADKELGGDYIAYVYNVGYARAMLQAAIFSNEIS